MVDLESIERWKEIFKESKHKGSNKNIQIQGTEQPTDEEGFLRLTIVDEKGGIKEFIVTHVLTELIERKRNRAEYFTTLKDGSKIGVSIEWKKREDVWRNLSDADLNRINKMIDKDKTRERRY